MKLDVTANLEAVCMYCFIGQTSQYTSMKGCLQGAEPLTVWATANSGKSLKRWEHQAT